MNRKKVGVKTITFDLGSSLKDKFDGYCTRRGLTLAEVLRCYILNLPEEDSIDTEAELSALIGKLTLRLEAKQRGKGNDTGT